MVIIDAQVHIWSSGTPSSHHRQVLSYTKDELLRDMDEAGVDAALLHPPSWDASAVPMAEAAAHQHPGRLAVLGRFALDDPASPGLLDGWKQRPGELGLRFTFLQPHQKTWMVNGTMDWLWPAAERAGLPVALMATDFLPVIGQVAERHPRLRLIVDHLAAVSGAKDDAAYAHLPALTALARHPNVAVKATGAPATSSAPYPYRNIHPHLDRIYDAFGPRRMFWGTDITRMPCSWRQCVTLFTEELPFLTQADKDLVMGRALADWIGWKLPALG